MNSATYKKSHPVSSAASINHGKAGEEGLGLLGDEGEGQGNLGVLGGGWEGIDRTMVGGNGLEREVVDAEQN